ncbi:hypothetical protein A5765_06145 [Mycolicibacterium celeriflavum]|uniref:hypothetical protein n=1 Tax=Mycolicibacterium celeriflavum TaxID=1249101 RepID=UPI0007FFAEBD|nr:hypothetical protein [Mycolicibacterium celeriflavum]OBG17477.1 hypothetical protein A5765_06145 [Mycolicibacterium celeriflavum]
MSLDDVRSRKSAGTIAVLALAFWFVVVGFDWALPTPDVAPHHGPHALSAAYPDSAVITPHEHVRDGSAPVDREAFAEAVLPRSNTALVALAILAALAVLLPFWLDGRLTAVRGPPKVPLHHVSGRVLLTRLCIARR